MKLPGYKFHISFRFSQSWNIAPATIADRAGKKVVKKLRVGDQLSEFREELLNRFFPSPIFSPQPPPLPPTPSWSLMISSCLSHYEYINTVSNDFGSVFRREKEEEWIKKSLIHSWSASFFYPLLRRRHFIFSVFVYNRPHKKTSFAYMIDANSLIEERRS